MRVLITGASGFAGRHLGRFCAAQGASVTGLGRRPRDRAGVTAELESYLESDLADAAQAQAAIRSSSPDRLFHLAAEASVARSWRDPAGVIKANVASTLNLLEAARRHAPGARVLIACSGEEYGEPEQLPISESHSLRPQSPYAVSKACADLAAAFFADAYELHVVRTRAFNHAGPGQSDTYVVSSFARQIAEAEAKADDGGSVEILTGNTDIRRDFTDVRDVVRAYWLALERADPGAYNVCSGRSSVISDILADLSRNTTLTVTRRTDPTLLREHEVMEIRGSHQRLTEATGWTAEIPLEQTLRDTLDWWRERTMAEVPG
jgi:GDP-4-dehydro-6-deoxy-D-mannose reductase